MAGSLGRLSCVPAVIYSRRPSAEADESAERVEGHQALVSPYAG